MVINFQNSINVDKLTWGSLKAHISVVKMVRIIYIIFLVDSLVVKDNFNVNKSINIVVTLCR